MTTTEKVLQIGKPIVIRHDLGIETGTLISHTDLDFCRKIGQTPHVTVQFSDGTISSWGYQHVETVRTLVLRNTEA